MSTPVRPHRKTAHLLLAALIALCALAALSAPTFAHAAQAPAKARAAKPHTTKSRRPKRHKPVSAKPTSVAPSPLAGMRWYVDPNSDASAQAATWGSTDPAGAAEMAKLAAQPTADWFGGWNTNVQTSVSARVDAAAANGTVAELVAYDIPERDCGGYSSGGAATPAAYESWIDAFAAGIGTHPAVVILEPDALPGLDCLSPADQATRLSLLRDAVSVLSTHAGVRVYLDAGHAGWKAPAVIAQRLKEAGIAQAQGFSLNVSNFDATSNETTYGRAISALADNKHFVIDTSRNGAGTNGQWCNPTGRALGTRPTAATGNVLIDAYLWVKTPGQSDGTCNGGPAAGTWWPSYALALAQSAAF